MALPALNKKGVLIWLLADLLLEELLEAGIEHGPAIKEAIVDWLAGGPEPTLVGALDRFLTADVIYRSLGLLACSDEGRRDPRVLDEAVRKLNQYLKPHEQLPVPVPYYIRRRLEFRAGCSEPPSRWGFVVGLVVGVGAWALRR